MRRSFGIVALAVLAATSAAAAGPPASSGRSGRAPHGRPGSALTADAPLVRTLYQETRATRELPDPSWGEYARVVGRRLAVWLGDHIKALGPVGGLVVRAFGYGILALALATLGVLLWRWGGGLWRRRLPARAAATIVEPASSSLAPTRVRPISWRDRIEEQLALGRVDAALEAVWWWLASSVADREIQASATSRELLERTGRRDLAPHTRALDRMMYGPVRPSTLDIRRFVGRLETVVT
jgi:hypothetical protein